jgi:hypothetical protein
VVRTLFRQKLHVNQCFTSVFVFSGHGDFAPRLEICYQKYEIIKHKIISVGDHWDGGGVPG